MILDTWGANFEVLIRGRVLNRFWVFWSSVEIWRYWRLEILRILESGLKNIPPTAVGSREQESGAEETGRIRAEEIIPDHSSSSNLLYAYIHTYSHAETEHQHPGIEEQKKKRKA